MAQATKMGADTATLEKRRKALTGHKCNKCGQDVSFGDLMMVRSWRWKVIATPHR